MKKFTFRFKDHYTQKGMLTFLPILFLFVFTKSFAQTDFLKNYALFGTNAAFVLYDKGVTFVDVNDCPVSVYYMKTPSFNLGLSFNVFHSKKIIFKTGIGFRYIYEKQRFHIDQDQTTIPSYRNDFITISSSDDMVFYIPLRLDYLFYKKAFVYSSINPGYYKEYGIFSYNLRDNIEIFMYNPEQQNWFYLDWEFGLGIYIPTKYALFQPYLYY